MNSAVVLGGWGCVVVLGGSKTTEGASVFDSPIREKQCVRGGLSLCFPLVVVAAVVVVVLVVVLLLLLVLLVLLCGLRFGGMVPELVDVCR